MLLLLLSYTRSVWVKYYLAERNQYGEFHRLVGELRLNNGEDFKEYFRVSRCQFDEILHRVGPRIKRINTRLRRCICPAERLAICLRHLATGDSYHSLSYRFQVAWSTVSLIVPEVAKAIWEELVDVYMPVPKESDWQDIAEQFRVNRDFPNCIGAIDGKHVRIGTFSIVLLVDANLCFRIIDVGAYGHGSDGGTLRESAFGRALQEGTLGVPPHAIIPGAEDLRPLPHTFVGDEAFPLRRHLMCPYPGRNLCRRRRMFSYCMSQARMVVEQAFGVLAARFRIYHRVMWQHPHNVEVCVKATCVLHNLLRRDAPTRPYRPRENRAPNPPLSVVLPSVIRQGANNSTAEAVRVREAYTTYFSSEAGGVHRHDPVS
uniref:DDE Tnp4 domain-containing protein n=1 Tax=Cyprinus carpio TaxID=7962 RepID=A0A8C2BK42_CYPCA